MTLTRALDAHPLPTTGRGQRGPLYDLDAAQEWWDALFSNDEPEGTS